MLKGEAKQYPPGNIRWGIGPAIVASGGVEVSKTIEWVEKTKARGSEGGCANKFVRNGHRVCSPTNSESSHGRVGIPQNKERRRTFHPR
jgi:hypothetical protein